MLLEDAYELVHGLGYVAAVGHDQVKDPDCQGGVDLVEDHVLVFRGYQQVADEGGAHACPRQVIGGDELGDFEADSGGDLGVREEAFAPAVEIVAWL